MRWCFVFRTPLRNIAAPSARLPRFVGLQNHLRAAAEFFERIFGEGDGLSVVGELLEAVPAAGDKPGTVLDELSIEQATVEIALDGDGWKFRGIDELSVYGIASQVPFRGGEQMPGGQFANDKPQVQITFAD